MSNATMVRELLKRGYITSSNVKDAMEAVDRKLFFPKSKEMLAYKDIACPTASGQTISAPSVVGLMLEKLMAGQGMDVLEIGTGCGYNTALLSYIVGKKGKVITFEKYPGLVELSKKNISRLETPDNVEFHTGDGSCGFEEGGSYDRIIVTAAMPSLRENPMVRQLKDTGRLVAPVGSRHAQNLTVFDKMKNRKETILPVIFVPLVGKCGFPEKPSFPGF